MNTLHRRALATVPLTVECVESFYDGTRSGTAEQCLKALCESHERLRTELKGAEILLEEDRGRIEDLEKALRYAASCSTLEMVRDTAKGMLESKASKTKLETIPKHGGPAFPVGPEGGCGQWPGMTLRDYFAGQAMCGYVSKGNSLPALDKLYSSTIADWSYDLADVMIMRSKS